MRYQQIKDILLHLKGMHHAMGLLYSRWQQDADAERGRLLLGFMAERETRACQLLDDYLQQLASDLLETWIDIQGDDRFPAVLEAARLPAGMTDEEILAEALTLDQAIIDELELIERHLDTQHLELWFDGLLQEERTRQHQLVHNVHRLDDI